MIPDRCFHVEPANSIVREVFVAKILVLNLGGSSSKIAIYDDLRVLVDETLRHSKEDMAKAPLARDQLAYRRSLVLEWLEKNGESMDSFAAVAARGATIKEARRSGTYLVDGLYKELLLKLYVPDLPLVHGNRIITPLALGLVGERNIPIYITDPSSVDEMLPKAKLSGLKGYERRARFHPLNQKIVCRKHAEKLGKNYKDCRFVVAHMGAGISVGAHEFGVIIDANDAGEGYGPFTPERAGTVSTEAMLDMCYNRKLSYHDVFYAIRGHGGVMSHLGVADMRKVESMIDGGDKNAELVFEAMAYQMGKEIGSYAAALKGELDAIILTGGIAYSERMVSLIKSYVEKFAPVAVYPGEFENEALAAGAYRVLSGQEQAILL
jgi:butyrate kinase